MKIDRDRELKIVKSVDELIEMRSDQDMTVGFVPTMGALHAGHLSLIRRARMECEVVIVSIFVNPTQFLEGEDLDSYPSKSRSDIKICEVSEVDILFMPSVDDIYESDELMISAPSTRGYILEGERRAGHFDGMLQVVMKLLNIARPTRAYFGKKDAQQLALVRQMVRNYFIPSQIVPCDIIRDEQGLALSSRNEYLSVDEKRRAYALSRSLKRATKKISSGILESRLLKDEMRAVLSEVDSIEYIEIVDREFCQIDSVEIGNSIILVAAKVGQTRLIDNIWV